MTVVRRDKGALVHDVQEILSRLTLLPGGIQIFYGDETARPLVSGVSVGGDGHAVRSDMNFGQNADMLAHWQKVGKFRANHVAVGAGSHSMISAYNSSTGYTFSRSYMDDNVTDSVVCCIGAPANSQIAVDVSSVFGNGKTVTNEYDGSTAVVTNGKATFNSGKQGVILISGPQSTISMSLKGAYSFKTDSETLTAAIRGADYAMVSVNGGAEFRVTNGQTFEIGASIPVDTMIEVTMTATNSVETLTKSFTFNKKDPNATTTIYFDDTQLNWGNVKAYVYVESGDDVIKNAAWPGAAMDYDSTSGLYFYDVPDELVNGLVIFVGDNGRYPGDGAKGLEIKETNMIFKAGNSWTVYNGEHVEKPTVDPDKTVTVYVNASSLGYSSPNIYYWSSATDSGPVKWPGVPMTKYKDNIYKASFPKEYDMCIFNQNGQTGNLKIPGNDYIYDNNSWSAYADAEKPTQTPTVQTTTQAPTTSPVTDTVLIGDADQNGTINIVDATEVQKHIVEMIMLSGNGYKAADANGDGDVNIKDVTAIQYYAAGNTSQAGNCGKKM